MAELRKDQVLKSGIDMMSILEFANEYGHGVSAQAIYNAIKHDRIDYFTISGLKFVVLTEKTKSYVPNAHPDRVVVRPKKTSIMTLN